MLTIYGIKNCSTVKKSLDFLEQQQVAYQFFDYKKQPPSAELLADWIEQRGLDTILNQRGTTWRKLTDQQKLDAASEAGAIELMIAQPSMIKRPIITDAAGQVLLLGFDLAAYQRADFAKN